MSVLTWYLNSFGCDDHDRSSRYYPLDRFDKSVIASSGVNV